MLNIKPILIEVPDTDDTEFLVTYFMHQFGVSTDLRGFQYLREIAMKIIDTPEAGNHIVNFYKEIAMGYDVTWRAVERSIRVAIGNGWEKANPDLVNIIFGFSYDANKGTPTASEFAVTIADTVRQIRRIMEKR